MAVANYLQTGVPLVLNLSGTVANGTYYYAGSAINNTNIALAKQISISAPNLYKTMWVYATNWGGATVTISTCPDEIMATNPASAVFLQEVDDQGNSSWTSNYHWNEWVQGNLWWRVIVSGATSATSNLTVRLNFGV